MGFRADRCTHAACCQRQCNLQRLSCTCVIRPSKYSRRQTSQIPPCYERGSWISGHRLGVKATSELYLRSTKGVGIPLGLARTVDVPFIALLRKGWIRTWHGSCRARFSKWERSGAPSDFALCGGLVAGGRRARNAARQPRPHEQAFHTRKPPIHVIQASRQPEPEP